jgi:hypothetical protein
LALPLPEGRRKLLSPDVQHPTETLANLGGIDRYLGHEFPNQAAVFAAREIHGA